MFFFVLGQGEWLGYCGGALDIIYPCVTEKNMFICAGPTPQHHCRKSYTSCVARFTRQIA